MTTIKVHTIKSIEEAKSGINFIENEFGIPKEVVTVVDKNAPMTVIGGYDPKNSDERNKYNALCARECISATMELLEQFFVCEPGVHMRDEESDGVRGKAGYVAAWNRNPQFASLQPKEGWNEIGFINHMGHRIYENLGAPVQEAVLKHTYLDMLLVKTTNFRIFVPGYLQKSKQNVAGEWCTPWIEVIRQNALLGKNGCREAHAQSLQKFYANQNIYNGVKRQKETGEVVVASELKVLVKGQEQPVLVSELPNPCVVFVWFSQESNNRVRTFEWDGSDASIFAEIQNNDYAISYLVQEKVNA
jgi:hypothetical protein